LDYEERNVWAGLIVIPISLTIYVVVIFQEVAARSIADVDWGPIMAWTIAASIVATVLISVVWGNIAGIRAPRDVGKSDKRDRDIARINDRWGQKFIVAGSIMVVLLSAFEVDWFWIANTMLFAFASSAMVGGIIAAVVYRRGFHVEATPRRVTNNICALREAQGLTLAELSRRVRITRQTLIAIESGRYHPRLKLAFQLSRVLGVGLEYVFQYGEREREQGHVSKH
jgi:DNA-binding XRE family transcriptional regulator